MSTVAGNLMELAEKEAAGGFLRKRIVITRPLAVGSVLKKLLFGGIVEQPQWRTVNELQFHESGFDEL